MSAFLRTGGALAVLAAGLALAAAPRPSSGQTSYIPRPPEPDTVLEQPRRKDLRLAPRDAWNPHSKDIRVPRNDDRIWNHRDYYAIPGDNFSIYILPIVENGHLGPKTNPRGFWKEFNRGKWVYAVGELKYVLNVFPNHPRALYLMTRLADLLNDPGLPVAYFEKALRMYPNRPETRAQYGAYLVRIGEEMNGMVFLEQALKENPNLLYARAWRDRARRNLGLPLDADSTTAMPFDPGAAEPTPGYTLPTTR